MEPVDPPRSAFGPLPEGGEAAPGERLRAHEWLSGARRRAALAPQRGRIRHARSGARVAVEAMR
jgi:hypothetical protein